MRRTSGDAGETQSDDLVAALLTASRVLVAVAAHSLAEHNEAVTITQFRTMVVLDNDPGTSLNRLAENLGVNASTAMRSIDRLVAGGLVTRSANPADRRETLLALTDAGRSIVADVTGRRRAEIGRIVKAMPPKQQQGLVAALRAFGDAAGEPDPSTSTLDW